MKGLVPAIALLNILEEKYSLKPITELDIQTVVLDTIYEFTVVITSSCEAMDAALNEGVHEPLLGFLKVFEAINIASLYHQIHGSKSGHALPHINHTLVIWSQTSLMACIYSHTRTGTASSQTFGIEDLIGYVFGFII